jgi:hypothetical protein
MTIGGWILVIFFWGLILGTAVFCFKKVFTKKTLK